MITFVNETQEDSTLLSEISSNSQAREEMARDVHLACLAWADNEHDPRTASQAIADALILKGYGKIVA